MWIFLEKLRQKSDSQKALISFVSALFLTLLIVVSIWLPKILGNNTNENTKKTESVENNISPIENINSQVSEIKILWKDMIGSINYIKNQNTDLQIESSVQ